MPISAVTTLRPGLETQQQREAYGLISSRSSHHQVPSVSEQSALVAGGDANGLQQRRHVQAAPGPAYGGGYQTSSLPPSAPNLTASSPALTPTPTVAYMSVDRKIDTWEKRYRELTPEAIWDQQKKLTAMQEDISAQLAALTRVCLNRMKGSAPE